MTGFSPPLLLPLNGMVDVKVSRRFGGSYVNGNWVKATPTTITITANIQPVMKSTDTMLLPEGDRSKEAIKVYTTTPLYQRKEGANPIDGDIISWDGKSFEVIKVISYKMGILDHHKAMCIRKEIT